MTLVDTSVWIDLHLLASARLNRCRLWTLNTRLRRVAASLRVAA